tara:strand:+ start:3232 stop:3393 length:162 start_codon:yes stop_codon:yes gene_type:complete
MAFFAASMPFQKKYFFNRIYFRRSAPMAFPKIAGKWLVFDEASGYEFSSHKLR